MIDVIEWIVGLLTIVAMERIARGRWSGWAIGLANQVVWCWIVYRRGLWFMAPLALFLLWTYGRALRTWRRGGAPA